MPPVEDEEVYNQDEYGLNRCEEKVLPSLYTYEI